MKTTMKQKNPANSANQATAKDSGIPKASADTFVRPKVPLDNGKERKFLPNNQYFTISIYMLAVVAISALIIRVVMTPHAVTDWLKGVINILMPFLIGILIAFILNPLIVWLVNLLNGPLKIKKKGVCKVIAIVVSYLLVLGIIALCLLYIIPQVVVSITEVIAYLPQLYEGIYDFFDNLQDRFPNADVSQLQSLLDEMLPEVANALRKFATDLVPAIYTTSVAIAKLLLNFVIAVIVSIYMLLDKTALQHSMRKVIYSFLPVSYIDMTLDILSECNRIFTNFFVGKAIDSLIIGVLCFILMNLFRMPYALLISVIVGITNMIPYFGPFIGAVPGVIVLLMVSPLTAVGFAVMIFLLQQFDGLYLGPKILGDTVGLKPLWIIISITVGGSIAGVLGMLLSVPVVAVLRYLLNLYLDYRLKKRNIQGL